MPVIKFDPRTTEAKNPTGETATGANQVTQDSRRTVPVYSQNAILKYVAIGADKLGITDGKGNGWKWVAGIALAALIAAGVWYYFKHKK